MFHVGTEDEGRTLHILLSLSFYCNLNIYQLYQVLLKSFKTHLKKLKQN